jgi:hypothetical protein
MTGRAKVVAAALAVLGGVGAIVVVVISDDHHRVSAPSRTLGPPHPISAARQAFLHCELRHQEAHYSRMMGALDERLRMIRHRYRDIPRHSEAARRLEDHAGHIGGRLHFLSQDLSDLGTYPSIPARSMLRALIREELSRAC